MSRILIVNMNWLGDVLFSTPFIRLLRKNLPSSYIACMVVPRCKEVLEHNPRLNKIILYDEDDNHGHLTGKLRFINELKKERFDTAILLHRSFTRTLLAYLAGIKRRVGYKTPKRSFLLTDKLPPVGDSIHRIDYFLGFAKPLGFKVELDDEEMRACEFYISDADRSAIRHILASKGLSPEHPFIVINPGGNWKPKRWSVDFFAELADRLISDFKVNIVITGSRRDVVLAETISLKMRAKPFILCGRTTLKQLGALFEIARLVISNDSGPMHISVAMRTNTIAIFGPTSPLITGPVGVGRYVVLQKDVGCKIPCYNLGCSDYRCMKAITVDDVYENVKQLYEG